MGVGKVRLFCGTLLLPQLFDCFFGKNRTKSSRRIQE